jgi:lipopolysaccharide export system permease protein
MSRLQRYIFVNALVASAAALLALAGMIWVSQAVRELDLVTGKGQTLLIFLQATILILPSLVLIVTPIALFIGVMHTLNKLNGDSELVVMSAAGLRPRDLFRPFLVLAAAGWLFCMLLTTVVMPESARALREIVTKVRADVITRILEEGRFVELDEGIVFHYRARDPDGRLLGVLFHDRRSDAGTITTYLAESGAVVDIDGSDFLLLENGSLQRQGARGGETSFVSFRRYAVDLAQFGGETEIVYRPRERTTWELLTTPATAPVFRSSAERVRAELHARFADPLFCFAAVAIAFAALGAPRTTRQGRGAAIAAAVVALVVVRSLLFGASTIAVRQGYGIALLYALPIATALIAIGLAFGPPRFRGAFAARVTPGRLGARA